MDPHSGFEDLNDSVRVRELDLAVLARAYKIIRMHILSCPEKKSFSDNGTAASGRDRDIQDLFVDWFVSEDGYGREREIALQMVFEEAASAPKYLLRIDEFLKLHSDDRDDELQKKYNERKTTPRCV